MQSNTQQAELATAQAGQINESDLIEEVTFWRFVGQDGYVYGGRYDA